MVPGVNICIMVPGVNIRRWVVAGGTLVERIFDDKRGLR